MAFSSPPALPHQPAEGGHEVIIFILVLTGNSALAAYLSWGDIEALLSILLCYVELSLLFALRLGSCQRRRGRWLKAAIWCLTSLLAVLLAHKLVRFAPPSALVLLVVSATALGIGGCCAYLLHRRTWSKQPCQEVTLQLVQELP